MILEQRFPFVKDLTMEGLESLRRQVQVVRATAGQTLVRKGDVVAGAYLVLEGSLRIYNLSPEGRETTLYWVEEGESCILALNSVFSSLLYPAWVDVEKDVTLAILPPDTFQRLFASEPAVQRFTFNSLSGLVFELLSNLEQSMGTTVEARLINFLLRKTDTSLQLRMSQEAIAAHIGTSREVVSRNLRSLKAQGFLKTHRGRVELLDVEGLVEKSLEKEEGV